MQLQVPVSVGEVLDKITILQIKLAHISDSAKRANVQNELDALLPLVASDAFTTDQMQSLVAELKAVNEALWDIEDDIREKEAAKSFDAEFIKLARAVYFTNEGSFLSCSIPFQYVFFPLLIINSDILNIQVHQYLQLSLVS